MAVLELLRHRIPPAWTYRVEGVIWRLVPAAPDLFVGESRNIDKKHASFFCINRRSGKVLWEDVSFEEGWWIGIEAIEHNHIFLHGFATPDMPEHRGITAVDVLTGRVVWKNQEVRFLHAVNDSVFAVKSTLDGQSLLELDGKMGTTLADWQQDMNVLERVNSHADMAMTAQPMFPAPLRSREMFSERAATVGQRHIPVENVVGEVEALEKGEFLLLGIHEHSHLNRGSDASITDSLKIVNLNAGNLVYADTLNASVSGVVTDMFFVSSNMLYYVKERATLVAVDLNELRR